MTDLAGSAALGGITFAAKPVHPPMHEDANALPALPGAPGSADPTGRGETTGAPTETAEAVTETLPAPKIDEKTLAGPPPTFKISLLELDRALQENLARVNAEMGFGAPEVQPIETERAESGDERKADADGRGESADATKPSRAADTSPLPEPAIPAPATPAAPAPAPSAAAGDTGSAPVMTGAVAAGTVEVPQVDGELS